MKNKTCIVWGVISIFIIFSYLGAAPDPEDLKEENVPVIETYIPQSKILSADKIEDKFKEIREIEENKSEIEDIIPESNNQTIDFTYEEAQLIMKIAQAEAGNQGEEGMRLVMSVIVNRKNDEAFPDSIKEVAYQRNCFATVSTGKINKIELSAEAHTALARIEKGEVEPDIIGFENKSNNSLERYFDYAFTYLDHNFYVKKK